MRKYGDDTHYSDSEKFMNGMVHPSKEYSSKPRSGYELTHNYKPFHSNNSDYNHEFNFFNKSSRKTRNKNIVKCPKCGKNKHRDKPCSYCNHVIVCPKCGKKYNKKHKGKLVTSCPYCNPKCPDCGKSYSKEQSLCPYCNHRCRKCGKMYSKELNICPYCNIECSECGKTYNTIDNVSCPHCKDKHDNLIVLGLCVAFIIFILIMMFFK